MNNWENPDFFIAVCPIFLPFRAVDHLIQKDRPGSI